MSTRKRIASKVPLYKLPKKEEELEEMDLKKVRAAMLKELDENRKKLNEWYDTEMYKNLKKA